MKPSIEHLNARRAIKPASGGTNYRARERARYAPDSEAAPFNQPHLCGAFVVMTEQTITPFVSLDEAVLRIHRKWERVVDAEHRTRTARIECGIELMALRARIEAGEAGKIGWWEWYQQKFTRDRRDAERIMAIASAENPQAAHEAEKAATRKRMQRLRARTGAQTQCAPGPEPEILPPEPSPQEIENQIVDLFKQLHRTAQAQCARRLRNIMQGRE
jgi:hypothetical protein